LGGWLIRRGDVGWSGDVAGGEGGRREGLVGWGGMRWAGREWVSVGRVRRLQRRYTYGVWGDAFGVAVAG